MEGVRGHSRCEGILVMGWVKRAMYK
jgi:hypothetical protein